MAIDGPTASGKSTTAKNVADILGYLHLNTGAMYRAFALYAHEQGYVPDSDMTTAVSDESLRHLLEAAQMEFDAEGNMRLNGRNVNDLIKAPLIAQLASELSTFAAVREKMVRRQQEMGEKGGVVLEGRDIGTVVFPKAELKIFLFADPNVRAERRQSELQTMGTFVPLEELREQITERDQRDRERTLSPLRKADDAIEIDTTHLSIEGQVERVVELAKQRIEKRKECS